MDNMMYLKLKKHRLLFLIAFLEKDHIANHKVLPEGFDPRFAQWKDIRKESNLF